MPYDFNKQRDAGKMGEKAVLDFLRNKDETVTVIDVSEKPDYQVMGVDAIWIAVSPHTDLLSATFLDVKTDFKAHRTGNLFIETTSTDEKEGNMLTTKAEVFLYYDPILGKLYHVPIFPLREWYRLIGVGKVKHEVENFGYSSEGFRLSIAELDNILQGVDVEDIEPMKWEDDKVPEWVTGNE